MYYIIIIAFEWATGQGPENPSKNFVQNNV